MTTKNVSLSTSQVGRVATLSKARFFSLVFSLVPKLSLGTRESVTRSVGTREKSVTRSVGTREKSLSKVESWLQSLAFQAALRRAYTTFADHYPEWVEALFDEHFLKHGAAPLLARYRQPQATPPSPLDLARAWDKQFGPGTSTRRERRIAETSRVAVDFLGWLEAELGWPPTTVSQRETTRPPLPVEPSQTGPSQLTLTRLQGRVSVTRFHLCGPLNYSNYLQVIATAREVYQAGGRHILLDLSDVPSLGLSSMLALHSIALILRGEQPLDPDLGWAALRTVAHDLNGSDRQAGFKLFNPQPQVYKTLEQAGFKDFLQIHTDLETAIASF